MFKIKAVTKPRPIDFIDQNLYVVDQISPFTAFVYSKTLETPNVMVYHNSNEGWSRANTIPWDSAIAARRMLTN